MNRFTYPREKRLIASADFRRVFEEAVRTGSEHFVLLGKKTTLTGARLGVVTSKKQLKLAHDRNRLKRLIRESFRLIYPDLPQVDFIMIARRGSERLDHQTICCLLDKLWTRQQRKWSSP